MNRAPSSAFTEGSASDRTDRADTAIWGVPFTGLMPTASFRTGPEASVTVPSSACFHSPPARSGTFGSCHLLPVENVMWFGFLP